MILSKNTTFTLLISNIFVIALALYQGWNIGEIMWVYWFQSVIIGLFHFLRIWKLENFSVKDVTINGAPATDAKGTKYFFAGFFALHYGLFHFVYMIFLITVFSNGSSFKNILIGAAAFFINHLVSFYNHIQADKLREPNIGLLMFYPYARIIPMHLTIIFGIMFRDLALILFLSLKTIADLITHSFGVTGSWPEWMKRKQEA